MVDILIEAAATGVLERKEQRGGPFWTTPLIGYVIYVNGADDLVYSKTTDGGATWAAANVLVTGKIFSCDCWADWQTAGDAGTKIHIAAVDADTNSVLYVSLDTSNDSELVDTIELCQGTGVFFGSQSRTDFYVSITKTRGGNIAVAFKYRDTNVVATYFYGFYTSPDGDTWTSKTSPWEDTDYILLFPSNEADNQDLWGVYWDRSANEISLKTFDDSGNSWSEQSIGASMADNAYYLQMDGVIRLSDGHLLLAAWNLYDNAAADLMTWDINGAGSITAKANVITNESETFTCSVFINQNTDDIYITYVSGSAAQATVAVFYQKSTDGGATWDGETAMQADAEDDERWVSAGAVKAAWGGKFQPVWKNDDLGDIFTNTDNGISIAAAGGGWSHSFLGVANANIGNIMGVALANIANVNGVA